MANTLKFGNGEWYGKKDTILAYNDENSNYKPLPFNFSRASKATVINKDGLIEEVGSGQPRIDYKDNSKGALLLEPQRTNLLTYSQDLSNWTKLFGHTYPVTDNSTDVISPSGLNDASKVEFDNSSQSIALFPSLNGTYSGFVYVKGIAGETIRFNFGGQEQNYTLTGEWDKLERENLSSSVSAFNLNTFGGATARTIYVWGAQLEEGSYPTSYIPTSGSAVTRLADVCSQTVPDSVIGQTEGSMYVDFNINTGQGIGGIIELINPSNAQSRVLLWDSTASSNNINLTAFFGAKSDSITLNNVSIGNHKAVLIYSNSFTKFFLDGVKIGEQVSNNHYSDINKIDFNHTSGGVNFQQKTIKDVKLYNNVLTDQEAIALTQV